MAVKATPSFDPKAFLGKVGEGRSIVKYRKDQSVFSQGEPADAVFYIQKGKVELRVLSQQGKEAVLAIWVSVISSARDASPGSLCAWRRLSPSRNARSCASKNRQ